MRKDDKSDSNDNNGRGSSQNKNESYTTNKRTNLNTTRPPTPSKFRTPIPQTKIEDEVRSVLPTTSPKWKVQSEMFRDSLRSARDVTAAIDAGRPIPSPVRTVDPSLIPCPHCDRRSVLTVILFKIFFCPFADSLYNFVNKDDILLFLFL